MDDQSGKACLLLLNLPVGAFCGIDLLSFTTSPRFRGIKSLPPGWHFVFSGVTNSFSLRHGVWFHVENHNDESPELHVMKWDPQAETLIPETEISELLKWRANLGSIWHEGLTPYRQSVPKTVEKEGEAVEEKQDWLRLTDCISSRLVKRILGSADYQNWALTSASSAKQDVDDIPGLSQEQNALFAEKDLKFLPINLKQTWPEGAIGRERTDAAQDRSWALGHLIREHCGEPIELIGELQFCFLMILTLNNNSCLEQWRRLLSLLLTCISATVDQPTFFVQALITIKLQLEHCQDADGGLFDLSDEGGSLLKSLLRRFRHGLDSKTGEAKQDVLDELDDLEEYLKSEHGWLMNDAHVRRGMVDLEDGERVEMDMNGFDEEDESGDYAPIVVNLDSEQAGDVPQPPSSQLTLNQKQLVMRHSEPEDREEEEELDLEDMDARY